MKIKALGSLFTVPAVNLILLLVIVTVVLPGRAEAPNKYSAEFRAFFADFSAAVRANDKNKIADLIAFPVKDWSVERKGNVETISIPTKAEFLRKYDSFF